VAGVVALLALLALLLSGCGGGIDLDDPKVSEAERTACTALVDALPHHVADQPMRETDSTLGAAWGDPAIVVRCGVGKPAGYDRFAGCQTANGVDWFVPEKTVADQGADVVLTTIGRTPRVELFVPAERRPPAAAMVDVAKAVKAHTRVVKRCS
jgi:uncharacterized protein DUF3515